MELLKQLNKYSLTSDNINLITKTYTCCNDIKQTKRKKPTNNDNKKILNNTDTYFVYEKDKLFWCFYILLNGYQEYQYVSRTFKEEINLKYKFIDFIRTNKDLFKQKLKQNKLKIENVIQNLGNQETITFETFKTLCLFYHINIAIKRNKLVEYYENNQMNETNVCDNNTDNDKTIINKQQHFFVLQKNHTLLKKTLSIQELQRDYIIVKDIEKPIKSITYYKLNDLQEYAKKLNIDYLTKDNKKKKKKDLYQEIVTYFETR